MFFTQEDYKKIQNWLLLNSVKDTEFKDSSEPFDGDETIAFVQRGRNVKAPLKDLIDQFLLLGVKDFLNISTQYKENYISLGKAIMLIPFKRRKIGQVITFLNENGVWEIYQFKGTNVNQWNNITLWENVLSSIIESNLGPDEEDLTSFKDGSKVKLKFKDKDYDKDNFSGLGRVYLRKNIVKAIEPSTGKPFYTNLLTNQMISKPNTIYIIQYDYDLNQQGITIPKGCTLDFLGGSISNGKIIFNNTKLTGDVKIYSIINGNIINDVYVDYFIKDRTLDCSPIIYNLLQVTPRILFNSGNYTLNNSIIINKNNISILGKDNTIINSDMKNNLFVIGSGVTYFNIQNLTIWGKNISEENKTSAIIFNNSNGGSDHTIRNLTINNVYYGINIGDRWLNNYVENIRLNSCYYSIYINSGGGQSINNTFNKCYSNNAYKVGVYLNGVKCNTFINLNVGSEKEGSSFLTIQTNIIGTSFIGCNFEGNTISKNGGGPINIYSGCNVIFNSCSFMSIKKKDSSISETAACIIRDDALVHFDNCNMINVDVAHPIYAINNSKITYLSGNLKIDKVKTASVINLNQKDNFNFGVEKNANNLTFIDTKLDYPTFIFSIKGLDNTTSKFINANILQITSEGLVKLQFYKEDGTINTSTDPIADIHWVAYGNKY